MPAAPAQCKPVVVNLFAEGS